MSCIELKEGARACKQEKNKPIVRTHAASMHLNES